MSQTRDRNFRLDNAKAILIVLVVWGHLIELAALQGGNSKFAFAAIYVFHMPAFVLVSGMVSKARIDYESVLQICKRILVPLFIFQLLYWPFLYRTAPDRLGGLLQPHWFLWFLFSLACWRLMLPLFVRLRFPVLSAVAITLLLGFVEPVDRTLGLSRTFFFFPAFLFGHLHAKSALAALRSRTVLSAIGFAMIIGAAMLAVAYGAQLELFFGRGPYIEIPDQWTNPALVRSILIGVGIIASVLFLALLPERETRYSYLGQDTLNVFLMHGFFVVVFWILVSAMSPDHEWITLLISLPTAVAFTMIYVRFVSSKIKRQGSSTSTPLRLGTKE